MKPKRTILCVDDDAQSLSVRKVLLETRGYKVVCCSNAEEALDAFAQGGVDLLLSDVVMPGMSGLELAAKIKAQAQIPAILFTGKPNIYDQDQVADIFLPKGIFPPAELLERIRLLLVRKRGPKRANTAASSFAAKAV